MLAAAGGRSDGVALLRPIRAQGDDAASLRNRAAAEFGAAAAAAGAEPTGEEAAPMLFG